MRRATWSSPTVLHFLLLIPIIGLTVGLSINIPSVGARLGQNATISDELSVRIAKVERIAQKGKSYFLLHGQGFDKVFNTGLTPLAQSAGTVCPPNDVLGLEIPFKRILQWGELLDKALVQDFQGQLPLDMNKTYYVCSKALGKSSWVHHGPYLTLEFDDDPASERSDEALSSLPRAVRQSKKRLRGRAGRSREEDTSSVEVVGMTFEYESDKKRVDYDDRGTPNILENMIVRLRLFGKFSPGQTYFRFSKFQKCDDPNNHQPIVQVITDASGKMGELNVQIPAVGELNDVYLCLKAGNMTKFVRQGESDSEGGNPVKPWLMIKIYSSMFALWLHITILVLLLMLSGLFSGLNLGLMSLDKTELKIMSQTGTEKEKQYARTITPVREQGNFLLCCLLFSNVLVNASLTILVDELTSGVAAVVMSTLAIVIFGEIIPQAVCSKHGLMVGAKTIYITMFFMGLTSPLAYPLSKLLDWMLGKEIGNVYPRERLKELLKVTKEHHGLEDEQVGIIQGTLDMKFKTVKDVIVPLDNAFMLPLDAILDFDTMADVEYHGYSRIPVFDKERDNIVALLNVKQLTLLDANDNIPLKTVVEYYQNAVFFVFETTRLDYMFRTFREGSRGHMAFVQRINDEGGGDPFYETIGIVTMEDVLEELLQADIKDETDVGKSSARLANSSNSSNRPKSSVPFHINKKKIKPPADIPPPLALAAVQFLSTSVEPFRRELLSVPILQRLVYSSAQYIKLSKHTSNPDMPDLFLFEAGKPAEYFILILEGKVEVIVGQEKLRYESKAFTTFGKDFLVNAYEAEKAEKNNGMVVAPTDKPIKPKKRTFIPDYTVKVVTDLHYLLLKYSAYRAAILSTEIEKANADPLKADSSDWQDNIEKIMRDAQDDEESCRKISKISSMASMDEPEHKIQKTSGDTIMEVEGSGDVPDEQTKLI